MTAAQRRRVLWWPLIIWGGLLLLLLMTWGYAYWPGAPVKIIFSLSISAAKSVLILLIFMQLPREAGLVRLAAMAGLVWASLLFLFAFADYLTR